MRTATKLHFLLLDLILGCGAELDLDADDTDDARDSAIECEPGRSRVTGELADLPIDLSLATGTTRVSTMGARVGFGDHGVVFVRAPGLADLDPATPVDGDGLLLTPVDGPDPAQWYCFDDTSWFEGTDDGHAVRMQGLQRLGQCGGDPIGGDVTVCFDCGSPSIEIAIDGVHTKRAIDRDPVFVDIAATELDLEIDLLGEDGSTGATVDGSVSLLHASTVDWHTTGAQTSIIDRAYLVMPPGSPDAGAVYCAEHGELDFTLQDDALVLHAARYERLSRLGSCADAGADDTLDVCVSF